jgi:hypothetical protein
MATTDILPFATAVGANVESQAAYAGSGHQLNGFTPGIALSAQLNKVWRQSAFVACGISNFCVTNGVNVPDDGNVSNFVTEFTNALNNWMATGTGVIDNNHMATMPTHTIKGNSTAATAKPTDMTFTSSSGIVVTWGASNVALSLAAGGIANASLANMASSTLKGHDSSAASPPQDLTVAGTNGITIGITSGVMTVGLSNAGIANASLANMPATTIKGNSTAGSAAPQDLTPATVRSMIGVLNTQRYQSSAFTIASGAVRIEAHGLGGLPDIVTGWLVCQTSEEGYVAGNWVNAEIATLTVGGVFSTGCALSWDSTNLTVQLASSVAVFCIPSRATGPGNVVTLTNANWKLVVIALKFT